MTGGRRAGLPAALTTALKVAPAVVLAGAVLAGCGASSGGSGAPGTAAGPGGAGGLATLLSGAGSPSGGSPSGGSASGGGTSPSGGAGPTTATGSPSPSGATRTLGPGDLPFFFSAPSKNIACVFVDAQVRCDINKHDWPTPARPASCELDYGNGLSVGAGRADFTCAGDTVLSEPTAQVLEYGQSVTVQDLTCTSQKEGVTCRNTVTGHGFTLAKEAPSRF